MTSTKPEKIEEVNSCAYCRTDATQICNGCHKAPDGFGGQVYTTWYCRPECQTKDWNKHKRTCKVARDRKSLYRAGETVQLAFYRYLETFFNLCITRLENKGEDLYLYRDNEDETHVLPFPWAHFTNEQDKQAALTWMACGNALGFAHVLLEAMLPDILQTIARVDYTPQPPKRRIIMINPDGSHKDNSKQGHAIIQVTLKNSDVYAIDITGAQYGYYDAVIPWDLYVASRVESIQEIQALGSIRECRERMEKRIKINECKKTIEEEIAEVFAAAAEAWQVENGSLSGMLKLKEDEFVRKRDELLEFINGRVRERKARLEGVQGPTRHLEGQSNASP